MLRIEGGGTPANSATPLPPLPLQPQGADAPADPDGSLQTVAVTADTTELSTESSGSLSSTPSRLDLAMRKLAEADNGNDAVQAEASNEDTFGRTSNGVSTLKTVSTDLSDAGDALSKAGKAGFQADMADMDARIYAMALARFGSHERMPTYYHRYAPHPRAEPQVTEEIGAAKSVTIHGGGALLLVSGAYGTAHGIEELKARKTADGVIDTAGNLANMGAGGDILVAGEAAAHVAGPLAGIAQVAMSGRDLYYDAQDPTTGRLSEAHAFRDGKATETTVEDAGLVAAGGLMAAGLVCPPLLVVGSVATVGILLYKNRQGIAEAATHPGATVRTIGQGAQNLDQHAGNFLGGLFRDRSTTG